LTNLHLGRKLISILVPKPSLISYLIIGNSGFYLYLRFLGILKP
jgi:hypothetical protein